MFNRTRSLTAWAACVAVLFSFSGCDNPVAPPVDKDLCPGVPGMQTSLPCEVLVPSITVFASFGGQNIEVVKGRVLPCPSITVTSKNLPSGALFDTTFALEDGMTAICGEVGGVGPQLITGNPAVPATAVLTVGSHTVTAKVSLRSDPSVTGESAPLTFAVVPEPDMIVMAVRQGVYPDDGPGDIWAGGDKVGSIAVRLTNSGGSKWFAAAFPDGSGLLWVSEINQYLWRSEMDGSNPRRYNLEWEGQTLRPEKVVVSPNSKKIAFMASIGNATNYSAFAMNADGTSIQRLLADRESLIPDIVWFPNSQAVITGYSSDIELGNYTKNNYVLVALTGEVSELLTVMSGQKYWWSRVRDVSPNGEWLMLWDWFDTDQAFLVRADGSGEVKDVPLEVWEPVFCPNGNTVCFLSSWTEVSSADFSGQNVQKLFSVPVSGWIDHLYRWNRSN